MIPPALRHRPTATIASILLALLLLGVAPVSADETASDGEVDAAPLLRAEAVELLPLSLGERARLLEEHGGLLYRLRQQAQQREQAVERLRGLADGAREARGRLREEIARIDERIVALQSELRPLLRPYGVDDAAIARAAAAPGGPHHVMRFAHAQVLGLDDLTDAQRALFAQVVPAVDGAVLALEAQQRRLAQAAEQAGMEPDRRRQLIGTFGRQRYETDRRFWRLVDYVLDEDQRFRLKERLPTAYARTDGGPDHLYELPDLEPTQAARLRAVLAEVDAQIAPDQALVRRVRSELQAGDLDAEARRALQAESREANGRIQEVRRWATEAVRGILTEAQWRAYQAIPPRLSTNDRRRPVRDMLEGLDLDAGRRATIVRLQREARQAQRELARRMRELRAAQGDVGADSPQMEMMEMSMMGARADGQRLQRELIGRLALEVLTPDEVMAWVLGLVGRVR